MKKLTALLAGLMLALNTLQPVLAAEGAATPAGIPVEGLEEFIDGYADAVIGVETASAAVAVWLDGEVVFEKAYGTANTETGEAVDTGIVYEWGSASKLLVGERDAAGGTG